ncbi:MAG: hypothetical protein WBC04_07285 [Candidatus Acidiferrales bacterium]
MRIVRGLTAFVLCALFLNSAWFAPVRSALATNVANDQPGITPALTIYNQQFAVVRQMLPLDLKSGLTHVQVTDITAHLEPDSVILRPLDASRRLQILEQNYRNDPVTQQLLLSLYEGKTIDFEYTDKHSNPRVVPGKIIRSGYVPHYGAYSTYGQQYYQAQAAYVQSGADQPIIEVNGRLQFSLPGQPVFPALADDTVLKPTLSWELQTDKPGVIGAEFSYVTGGMNWEASYNVVAPPKGNVLELVGWVTLDNQSGMTFRDARFKLMAGDVNKIQPPNGGPVNGFSAGMIGGSDRAEFIPPVKERTFDEYHLYTLQHSTTLHDRETKQVEFVRASGIRSQTVYVYDGFKCEPYYQNWPMESIRQQESFGLLSNPKVWVMQEFKNSNGNHLGMPLPRGRVRFYHRDDDGQLEFTGENQIDHTPKDETIRLYTGSAFDLAGERRRLDFKIDTSARWVDETFEIKVRNHKTTPVEARIVEHPYRWTNWEIRKHSDSFKKVDSRTMEFTVQVPPDGEKTVNYEVHYSW